MINIDDKLFNNKITGVNAMIEHFNFNKGYPFHSLEKVEILKLS